MKYASGPVSRACSRAGPACLPLPLAGPRCLRPRPACVRPAGPLPLLAAAARAHRALAGSRWPLGHARRCRAPAPCRAGPLPPASPPARRAALGLPAAPAAACWATRSLPRWATPTRRALLGRTRCSARCRAGPAPRPRPPAGLRWTVWAASEDSFSYFQ